MPQSTVVDASALAAVLFGEPQRREVVGQLAESTLIELVTLDAELASAHASLRHR